MTEAVAFTHNLPEAAYRNLQAADTLDSGHRRDVAGYLYGIAAECAVKQMIKAVSLPPENDRNAIFYAHFPELRTLIRDALKGRGSKPLSVFIFNDACCTMRNSSGLIRSGGVTSCRTASTGRPSVTFSIGSMTF
jgi:hypothetical protein